MEKHTPSHTLSPPGSPPHAILDVRKGSSGMRGVWVAIYFPKVKINLVSNAQLPLLVRVRRRGLGFVSYFSR